MDGTWITDPRFHQRKCDAAPNAVPRQMIRRREVQLDRCFENAGRNETECTDYAAEAVSMFQKGIDNRCEVEESRRWNASRSRHYAWCLDASAAERKAEAAARKSDVDGCIKRAVLRKTCDEYAEAAVSQALRNERQRCGFRGVSWSKYSDDHFDFCMQADDADREDEAANRDRDLKTCEQKDVVDEECDTYAKRAVRLNDLAEDKDCRLTSVELWSSNYRQHYRFCIESNDEERQAQQQQRRRQLRQCAFQRGFQISIDVDF